VFTIKVKDAEAKFKKASTEKGVTITGDVENGTIVVMSIVGNIEVEYRCLGKYGEYGIDVIKKPMLISEDAIESRIRKELT
jgi:hypothetical protein